MRLSAVELASGSRERRFSSTEVIESVLSPFLVRPTFTWNFDAESEANAHDVFRAAIWSEGINYLGLPAGVLPTGMAAGMPAAVQLIGRRFREDVILDAMAAIEARVGVMTDTLWQRL
jgi:amidase